MTDPVTDMLNRIRNAQAVLKETVSVPYSNFKYEIAKIINEKGFVEKIEKKGRQKNKTIEITLKYNKNDKDKKEPFILGLRKISKPSQRIYSGSKEIKRVRGGYGIAIVSTSQGIISSDDARKRKLGGEIICELW